MGFEHTPSLGVDKSVELPQVLFIYAVVGGLVIVQKIWSSCLLAFGNTPRVLMAPAHASSSGGVSFVKREVPVFRV